MTATSPFETDPDMDSKRPPPHSEGSRFFQRLQRRYADVFASLPHSRFPGGKWLAQPLATLGLLYYAMRDRL